MWLENNYSPSTKDVLADLIKHYYDLQFSPAVETIVKKDKKILKEFLEM